MDAANLVHADSRRSMRADSRRISTCIHVSACVSCLDSAVTLRSLPASTALQTRVFSACLLQPLLLLCVQAVRISVRSSCHTCVTADNAYTYMHACCCCAVAVFFYRIRHPSLVGSQALLGAFNDLDNNGSGASARPGMHLACTVVLLMCTLFPKFLPPR